MAQVKPEPEDATKFNQVPVKPVPVQKQSNQNQDKQFLNIGGILPNMSFSATQKKLGESKQRDNPMNKSYQSVHSHTHSTQPKVPQILDEQQQAPTKHHPIQHKAHNQKQKMDKLAKVLYVQQHEAHKDIEHHNKPDSSFDEDEDEENAGDKSSRSGRSQRRTADERNKYKQQKKFANRKKMSLQHRLGYCEFPDCNEFSQGCCQFEQLHWWKGCQRHYCQDHAGNAECYDMPVQCCIKCSTGYTRRYYLSYWSYITIGLCTGFLLILLLRD